jgi:hypothetical protein
MPYSVFGFNLDQSNYSIGVFLKKENAICRDFEKTAVNPKRRYESMSRTNSLFWKL